MDAQVTPLAQLRQEIDRIDDAMHDLLMQRARVVEQVAKAKPAGGTPWRPAREAQILRRLLARHEGSIPPEAIEFVWRGIIGFSARMQGSISIGVTAGTEFLAHRYFGSMGRLFTTGGPTRTFEAVVSGKATIGVVPWPEDRHWWVNELPSNVFVVGRLPFVNRAEASCLTLACMVPEPSGDDRTLIAMRQPGSFAGTVIAQQDGWTLLELPHFMPPDDSAFQISDVRYVGSFAAPYTSRTA